MSEVPHSRAALRARARRVRAGEVSEAAAAAMSPRPSLQGLMQLPLLEILEHNGGRARPGEVYEAMADRLGLSPDAVSERRDCAGGQSYAVYQQQVRWARQTAVMRGLIHKAQRGIWELADPGYAALKKARRGTMLLVFDTALGCALWGHAEELAAHVEAGSAHLVMTSPLYPVKRRGYGHMDVPSWLAWMKDLMGLWKSMIAEDGTIAVNLGEVFVPGSPSLSPYMERFTLSAVDELGLSLLGKLYWESPTRLGNIEWAARRRLRPRWSVEPVILFGKGTNPGGRWDNRRVLKPYSPATRRWAQRHPADERAVRPSGYAIRSDAFHPTGEGAIAGNLLVATGAAGGDAYSRRCRAEGVPLHPARFPAALPRHVILLTTQPGDLVVDPFAGSFTTAGVAEDLGRRWISSECMLDYCRGGSFRFEHRPGFCLHGAPGWDARGRPAGDVPKFQVGV